MSKLTWHLQTTGGAVDAIIAGSGAQYVKIIDPPTLNPFPGKQIIGRTYLDDGAANELVAQGAAGADAWFARFMPVYQSRAYVTWWEGPNEPQPIHDPAFRQQLVAFTLRLAERLHGIGKRIVALNLSVGAPDILDILDFKPLAGKVDAIGLHEYSAPNMQNGEGWYCLRYRKYVAAWAAAGLSFPPIIIGECGIDGGVLSPPRPRTGWKSYTTRYEYMRQLAWYDNEIMPDAAVMCATIFTANPDYVWTDFDFDLPLSQALAQHIAPAPPIIPEVPVSDPRAANCKAFHMNAAGQVDGIELVYEPVPSARYACVSAQLIDEAAAQGNTVVTVDIFDANGIRTAERALMEWPYGGPPAEDSPVGSGNPSNQFATTSIYAPPAIGPLGFMVGDANKQPISDHIWGYGLPGGRHISGYVAFKERSVIVPPEPPIIPPTGDLLLDIRNLAYNNIGKADGIPYNPTLAFPREANRLRLGAPLTLELRQLAGYVVQGFALGILWCVDGAWGNINNLSW